MKLKSLYPISYAELSKLQKLSVPLKILLQKNKIYQKNIKGNYEVEIAFLEGPITRLFSSHNLSARKIAWVHNDIGSVFGTGIKAKLKRKMDEAIYSKYETLVFVSKENLENFERTYPTIKENKTVIYNYIEKENILKKAEQPQEELYELHKINFVTVARLVPQKGIDRLVNVHTKLLQEGLEHQIYVIGDGPEKEKLEQMIQKNKIEKSFILLGKRENPYPYIKNADYFCLFSRFEGYGMVLEEAKILDKPILITDTAAREAVIGYEESTIAKNTEERHL